MKSYKTVQRVSANNTSANDFNESSLDAAADDKEQLESCHSLGQEWALPKKSWMGQVTERNSSGMAVPAKGETEWG